MIRISRTVAAAVFLMLLVATGFLVPHPLAQSSPSGTVALTDARVIDGTGSAPLERATIVVNNGRIQAVGASAAVKIPSGATRLDMSGKTIMPGMINAHAHLNVDKDSGMPVRDELIMRLRTYADYGVTSAVSLGSTPADELEGLKLRDEQSQGSLDRARLYTGALNAI